MKAFYALLALPSLVLAHPKMSGIPLYTAGYNGTITSYLFKPSHSLIKLKEGVAAKSSGSSPTWLEFSTSGDRKIIYSADEESPGRIFAHQVAKDGTLHRIGTALQIQNGTDSGGDGPVSCVKGEDRLFVANYNSGTAAVLDILTDGSLAKEPKVFQFTRKGTGPVADRQDHSYAHQVSLAPTRDFVYVCDLGADQIHRLKIGQKVEWVGSTNLRPGTGPRHITFYQQYAYLASELDNTVTAFERNVESGELSMIGQPISPAPEGTPLSGQGILPTNRTTAEIAVSPDGKYIYISNRGDKVQDHISILSRHTDGSITFKKWIKSGGIMPRHFSLSPDGRYLAVGHQTDQNIVIFERDQETGDLTMVENKKDAGKVAFTGFAVFN